MTANPRHYGQSRREQGFRSQAHLDAFYASLDHDETCTDCRRTTIVTHDDDQQGIVVSCPVAHELYLASLAAGEGPIEQPTEPTGEEFTARLKAEGDAARAAVGDDDEEELTVEQVAAFRAEVADALTVEADLPPTEEDRVTVRIRAAELRPGDLVVDSLGGHRYAAFDVQLVEEFVAIPYVRIWTAIRDQENGLPPEVRVPAARELLVLRSVSDEGRELLAALDRVRA